MRCSSARVACITRLDQELFFTSFKGCTLMGIFLQFPTAFLRTVNMGIQSVPSIIPDYRPPYRLPSCATTTTSLRALAYKTPEKRRDRSKITPYDLAFFVRIEDAPYCFKHLSERIRGDKDLVLRCVSTCSEKRQRFAVVIWTGLGLVSRVFL